MPEPDTRRLIILGSTGSIGVQTLDVVAHLNALADRGEHPTRYEVVALAAGRNASRLRQQADEHQVEHIALADEHAPFDAPLRRGADAAESLIQDVEADLVVSAMVGAAGLPATLAAARKGIDIALANKETLVAAGALVTQAAHASGAALLPLDSEHSALWQCLAGLSQDPALTPALRSLPDGVRRLILTASGGPFREWPAERIASATREQALAHPTWNMGPKITVDCASMTNKALELIEAHWLYAAPADRLGVLVHPQSIVHSVVECHDGSQLAQLGTTDMRTPIQIALTHPCRAPAPAPRLDLASVARLDFEAPDPVRFPSIARASEVIERGGIAGAVFNAANEAAVEAFLEEGSSLPFGAISELAGAALDELGSGELTSLDDALAADAEARRYVARRLVEA